jgi:hypothetical protein
MQKDRSKSSPQAITSYSPSEIVLATSDKLPKRIWSNVDEMLFERNKSRDLKCRICRKRHNPETGVCGCETL